MKCTIILKTKETDNISSDELRHDSYWTKDDFTKIICRKSSLVIFRTGYWIDNFTALARCGYGLIPPSDHYTQGPENHSNIEVIRKTQTADRIKITIGVFFFFLQSLLFRGFMCQTNCISTRKVCAVPNIFKVYFWHVVTRVYKRKKDAYIIPNFFSYYKLQLV